MFFRSNAHTLDNTLDTMHRSNKLVVTYSITLLQWQRLSTGTGLVSGTRELVAPRPFGNYQSKIIE